MRPWNKGLTKETDIRLKELSRKQSLSRRGVPWSKERKEKAIKNNIWMKEGHGLAWKGGSKRSDGYVTIRMPDHPRANKQGRVREHIVIAEKKIGRNLRPGERVHHINGIRDDNRPENLVVIKNHSEHMKQNHTPVRNQKGRFV